MADIQVTVQLNDRASRQLRNIDKAASSLSTSLKAAGAAAAAFATGSIVTGIAKQYSAFERYRSVLTTYLGSQQKANAELKRLQNLANALPQDLQDITEAFTILKRNGIDTSSKSLSAFSNIATANGKTFEQLAEAVGDALTGEFERLKEFGIKVSKENDQFTATIGSQQVAVAKTSTDLVRQLQALGEEGGRFGNAAKDNANSLNQSYSNLSGAVFETSVSFMDALKPALKDAVDLTAQLLRTNNDLAKSLGAGVGESLRVLARGAQILAESWELVRSAFYAIIANKVLTSVDITLRSMNRSVSQGSGLITALGKALKSLLSRFNPVVLAISTAIGVLSYFSGTMVEVGNTTASLGEIFRAVFQVIGNYITTFATYAKQSLFGEFLDRMGEKVTKMKEWFAWAFDTIGGYAKTAANFLANSFVAAGETIIAVARNIPEFFGAAFDAVVIASGDLVRAVAQRFTNLKQALQLALSGDFAAAAAKAGEDTGYKFTESFANAFKNLPSLTEGVDYGAIFDTDRVGQGMDILSEKAGALKTTITKYTVPAMEKLTGAIVDQINVSRASANAGKYYDDAILRTAKKQQAYNDSLKETKNTMNDITTSTVPKLKEAVEGPAFNAIEKINSYMDNMIGRVSSTFTDVLFGLKDGFKSLEDLALDALKMIISTLIEAFIRSKILGQSIGGLGGGVGGGGGFLGGLFGSLGSLGMGTLIPGFGLLAGAGMLLGGLFADGGNTAKAGQKPIIVGEQGPELFMPGKAGTVVSNEDLSAAGGKGDLNVNFTINAIDTQTGVEFLLENKRVITGVIQEAYMRRGSSGPLG